MTFSDIMNYFKGFGIETDHKPSYNSKYVYVKEVLPPVTEDVILKIADELDLKHNFLSPNDTINIKLTEPTFWKPGYFKLFLSHLAAFKKTTASLKNALEAYGISSFVAHEDIEPTKEWQVEIENGLFTMDALCAVLIPGFNLSRWTDQEIGVAVGRNVLVIPVRKGMDPYGFIGKFQGFQAEGKSIGEVASAIFDIISTNSKTKDTLIIKLSELFLLSNTEVEAKQRISAIKRIKIISKDRIGLMHQRITDNLNLRSTIIINEFNDLARPYNYVPIKPADFDKTTYTEDDDLPF
ncbi:MAG: toll/interleukin-1 receptor domain-containing protein [Flavobacterium sp.]|nr:MAG: toll/interleukin-1 receptor domain-containing protein [Flavobacterium sp.]